MDTSSASPINLWIEYNLDGLMSLRSIMERYFPFLFFEVVSKINFLEDLSRSALCTKKVSSYEKTPLWMESLATSCVFSCTHSSSSGNQILSIPTSKTMS
jgi:hypothetical protein